MDNKSKFDIEVLKKHKVLLVLDKEETYIQNEIKKSYLRLGLVKRNIKEATSLNEMDLSDFSHIYISEKLIDHTRIQEFLNMNKKLFVVEGENSSYKKLKGHVFELEALVFSRDIQNKTSNENKTSDVFIKNRTILTVDDNPINLDLMESILKKMGARVLRASDGLAALSVYKESISSKKPIDMIFMDQNMPNMNGTEATSAIQAYEKEEQIPATAIIGLCGSKNDTLQEQFEEAGMLDCLCKPVCLDTIKKTLIKYINVA
ncbi:MAG TPA: response regulator [Sulfurimonas sp.]|nr:response regulator [Sulfurimonas sp.]